MIRLLLVVILITASVQQHCVDDTCWDENSTSTERIDSEWSESTEALTTVTTAGEQPAGPATTEAPSSTSPRPTLPPHIAAVPQAGTICWCDRTSSACDINCCCDKDCSIVQKQVFTHCQDANRKGLERHHCYSSDFLHKKPTQQSASERSDFFCVAKDNSLHKKEFAFKPPMKSVNEFNRAVSSRKREFAKRQTLDEKFKTSPYKYSATVWAVSTGKVHPLVIPGLLFGDLCLTTHPVKFLLDVNTSCRLELPRQPQLCSKAVSATLHKWNNVKLLTSPSKVNSSNFKESIKNCESQDSCIPVRLYQCQELNIPASCNVIENTDNISKTFDCDKSGIETMINILHNGTDGIQEVHVKLQVSPRRHLLGTSIKFEWNGLRNENSRGGGNPGYKRGDAIPVGKKIARVVSESNSTRKEIEAGSIDKSAWLTSFQHDNGRCSKKRQRIFFGENAAQSCVFTTEPKYFSKKGCQQMQADIFDILLGTTNWAQPIELIASYSNSIRDDVNEWVPILSDSVATGPVFENITGYYSCKNVISSLFVDIVIAKFGSFSNPKQKIIGVMYRLGAPNDMMSSCLQGLCGRNKTTRDVLLKTEVNFIDLTRPAVVEYARPPGLEAKLPHDFFYPFFSSAPLTMSPSLLIVVLMKFVQAILIDSCI